MASAPEKADPFLDQISSQSDPKIEEVPFSLVANHERKTARLLSNSAEQQSLKSRNSFFYFRFNEPIFVRNVEVSLGDFIDGSKFFYRWEGVDGAIHEGTVQSTGDELKISIYGIAKSIAFKPPRAYFTKPDIHSVTIFGFELVRSGDFVRYAEKISGIKTDALNRIEKELEILDVEKKKTALLQTQRGSLNQDISALKSTVSREQGKVKRIESQRDELIAKVGELERAASDEESRLQKAKEDVGKASAVRSNLSKYIAERKNKLSELEANIHLFPSELADFSIQGAKDSRTFLLLSVAPLLLIIFMFCLLTKGAADLTTKITGSEDINLAALAVSRAPYVIIACTIITASYYLVKMLVLEMIRISRQRLALTKISIIAKDISASIDSDLELTQEERYGKRILLKMDMMKDHLKEYLSSDFKPTLPSNIAPSLSILNPHKWLNKEAREPATEES